MPASCERAIEQLARPGRRTDARPGPRRRPAARRPASASACARLRRTRSGCRASRGRTPGSPAAARDAVAASGRSGISSAALRRSVSFGALSAFCERDAQGCAAGRTPSSASSRCRAAPRAARRRVVAASVGRSTRSHAGRGCHAGSVGARRDARSTDRLPGRCRSRRRATPIAGAVLGGISPRSSIVRYEMQRVESSTPGATSACVGHASRQSVQVPHWSSAGASTSSGRLQMISARKIHEPSCGLITQVFLPIQPMPGVLRVDALLHRAGIDVGARLERLGRLLAHPREQRVEPRADHVVVVVAPRVARDLRTRRIGALGRVRTVGVVNGRRDDHRLRATGARCGRRRGLSAERCR